MTLDLVCSSCRAFLRGPSKTDERQQFHVCTLMSVSVLTHRRRILLNYAVFNPDMGYCQGMSDLVAPLLTEIQDESDTFWCFVGLMENTIFISSPRDEDMERQLVGRVGLCRTNNNNNNKKVPAHLIRNVNDKFSFFCV